MIQNPHMLPKVRSDDFRRSAIDMPCTLRIAGFVGLPCAPLDTNVMCHMPVHGKGIGTKVSDLHMCCGCATCHDMLDERDARGRKIRELYPHAYWERLLLAMAETQSRWVAMDLIYGDDWEIV